MSKFKFKTSAEQDTLVLYSSYPGNYFPFKKMCTWFGRANVAGKDCYIDRGEEADLGWSWMPDKIDEQNNIFDIIHKAIKLQNMPASRIYLQSANLLCNEVYDEWCSLNNIKDKINIQFKNDFISWADLKYKNLPIVTDVRERYFFCPNRSFRFTRAWLAQWFYDNNIVEDYGDKIYYSLMFHDSYPEETRPICKSLESQFLGHDLDLNYTRKLTDPYIRASTQTYFDVTTEYMQHDCYTFEHRVSLLEKFTWWRELAITEKTFRSMILCKPFLTYSEVGAIANLKNMGFKTFDGILFDESYDRESSDQKRLEMVMQQAFNVVDNYTIQELHDIYWSEELQAILKHNLERFNEFNRENFIQYNADIL